MPLFDVSFDTNTTVELVYYDACPKAWVFTASVPARMIIDYPTIATYSNSFALNRYNAINDASDKYFYYTTTKTYQMQTNTYKVIATASSFRANFDWGDDITFAGGASPSFSFPANYTQSFYHYSTPPTNLNSYNLANYHATKVFGTGSDPSGILNVTVNELDFYIQGFSHYKIFSYEFDVRGDNALGWYYDLPSNTYYWYDYISGTPSQAQANVNGMCPTGGPNGGKTSNPGYRLNNYIAKIVPYTYFNFSFYYQNTSPFPLKIYTSPTLPSISPSSWADVQNKTYTPPAGSILLATLTQSVNGITASNQSVEVDFFGVKGLQYLIFVGGFAGPTASGETYSNIFVKNIKIDGGYHPGNNRQYIMNNFTTYSVPLGLTNAAYSSLVGTGNTVNATASLFNPGLNRIYSKLGNGTFQAGVWENGVWNSGWRVDQNMYEFNDVVEFFSYNKNRRWRFQVSGPTSSVANFNIGDNVSIGNIVAVDINDNRRVLKGYYTIINKNSNSIVVEFDSVFPLRRIKRDSDKHRIYVTKNVWLSGGFLNGYFTGVWNYGLFKGYPLITEMFNSHWIDGKFEGGHFYSELYKVPDFTDTNFRNGKVSLTFTQSHGLAVGDVVTINKTLKTVNPQYDGDQTVIEVIDNYQVTLDLDWGTDTSIETGKVSVNLSKGLVQKVNFKANNISKLTSGQSMISNAVFVYNSWMDVVYDINYASNIGKPQSVLNQLTRRPYSENNLYGFITEDVLESTSSFRDSFSTTVRNYRLGTKYKVFADFIGDAGKFEEDFGGTYSDAESNFTQYGWTFSRATPTNLKFTRTTELESTGIVGEELLVEATGRGGVLDITPNTLIDVPNRDNQAIEKLRYTKVEFNLITFSSVASQYNLYHRPFSFQYQDGISLYAPNIHFNNLNYVYRYVTSGSVTALLPVEAKYLPIYRNVNHLTTTKQLKTEYFFNKRNLGMNFYGYSSTSGVTLQYVIDSLHLYEIDMIPFFSYFTEGNINKGIMVPFQGLSPFIDYTNSNFNFLENINIGLDSIQTQNSNTVVSGVGVGIGVSTGNTVLRNETNRDENLSLFRAP